MNMEEKLSAILARIDASNQSEDDKVRLYGVIAEGLKASVWPVLISQIPKDKLEKVTSLSGKEAVKGYLSLIDDATKDGKVLDEIDETLNKLLDEVDTALKEENI